MDNLVYRPRYKKVISRTAHDHYQDLARKMVQTMTSGGNKHRVSSSRSGHRRVNAKSISARYARQIRRQYAAVQIHCPHVANLHGKTVTFMPKPLFATTAAACIRIRASEFWKAFVRG